MSSTGLDEAQGSDGLHRLCEIYTRTGNGVDAWAAIRCAILTQQPLPEALTEYLLGIADWALVEFGAT